MSVLDGDVSPGRLWRCEQEHMVIIRPLAHLHLPDVKFSGL